MRIRLVVSYDGSGYVGWQRQRYSAGIQGEIEDSIFRLTGEKVRVEGSGRTDAGVHAYGQVCHFDLIKEFNIPRLPLAMNYYLPKSIRVHSAEMVDDSFHARKSAKSKTYVYVMYKAEQENALFAGRALKLPMNVDVARMQQAAKYFEGKHDFYTFMSAGSSAKTTVRTVFSSEIITLNSVEELADNNQLFNADNAKGMKAGENACQFLSSFKLPKLVVYRVTANGFLYNMVRKMVGCLIRVGENKLNGEDIPSLIEARQRDLNKDTAKPYALYLHSVEY